jgi:hypothetical protein
MTESELIGETLMSAINFFGLIFGVPVNVVVAAAGLGGLLGNLYGTRKERKRNK